ncbi:MAG TPA: amidohydrolase family protein [Candidatus Binatia bacterium]|nr:amidohydrolase family protein [Candidatus Binatia bacterium]
MSKNGLRAFDSDMHVFEPADLYTKYMNPKWGERIPRGQPRTKHGMTRYFLGNGKPIRPPSDVVDFHESRMADRFKESLARDYDNISQLAAMDKEGLDIAVLFRTSPLHTNENFEPEYANDLCKAWNDWMVDFCKADSWRLKGSALITLHDVNLAVKEAQRTVKNGAVGLSLCPEPINARQIHDRYFDPLWREAQEMNIPICFHPPARPQQPQVSKDRFEGHPNQALLVNPLRNPIEQILAVSAFTAGGVLERFPKLKVAFLEGNCSWLPWLLYRIDEYWEMQGAMADIPLRKKPSEYFKEQCFISVDVDEGLVKNVIDYLGDDNIVISTDYPHIDCRWPHALDEFLMTPISEQSKKKILWDNCARLYNHH